jgi:benzodiazapine receptor
MKKRENKIFIFIFCLIIVFNIAFIGSIFTSPSVNSEWFEQNRPSLTPPNYVFPIVWNILYLLIAISFTMAWISSKKKQKKGLATIFGINLIANTLWSFLFFKLQNPIFAFLDIIIILITIILMITTTYKINKLSSYLLIPYLIWVSFASYLNWLFI